MYIKIPNLQPYPHQERILKAVAQGKHAFMVVHRRSGKDIVSLQCWLLRALQRIGTHVYLFPLFPRRVQ